MSDSVGAKLSIFPALVAVLHNVGLSDVDVLGGVYHQLQVAGLAFDGTIGLPPKMSYLSFMHYSANLIASDPESTELDQQSKDRLLMAIKRTSTHNVMLASFGYIIAACIAPKETAAELSLVLSSNSVRGGSPVSIVLHNTSLAAIVLAEKKEATKALSEAFAALLPKVSGEEQREDVLSALSVMDDPSSYKAIFVFLNSPSTAHQDLDYQTALLAYKFRMTPEVFSSFYEELTAKQSDRRNKAALNAFRRNNFRYGMASPTGIIKVWDEYKLTVYDDGIFVKSGAISDFRNN